MEIEHPLELLKEIKSILVVGLNITNVNILLKDMMPDRPEGLYLPNTDNNLLPKNGYYTYNADGKVLTPEELLKQPEDVYDNNGVLYLRKSLIDKYKDVLKTKPDIDVCILDIVESYILDKLDEICYKTNLCVINHLYTYIDDKNIDVVTDVLEYELSQTIGDLYEFIGNDKWNIYFKKRVGHNLIIEKSIDRRIYEWQKIEYEKMNQEDL